MARDLTPLTAPIPISDVNVRMESKGDLEALAVKLNPTVGF